MGKLRFRRQHVRERKARSVGTWQRRLIHWLFSWPTAASMMFVTATCAVALLGEQALPYAVGQRVNQPIHADVDFQVPDPEQTAEDRKAARAATPSYYRLNDSALTFDRIRADLMRVYEAAATADDVEQFRTAMRQLGWPADDSAYSRLRSLANLPDDAGRAQFDRWVQEVPLEQEYVVRGLLREPRDPISTTEFIVVETAADDSIAKQRVRLSDLVRQANERALTGSASSLARRFAAAELTQTVEAIVLATLHEQPTIIFDQTRTVEEMKKAESRISEAFTTFEAGSLIVATGVLGSQQLGLLDAHHKAYLSHIQQNTPQVRALQRTGLLTLIAILSVGLLIYARLNQPRIFEVRTRTIGLISLIVATLLSSRLLDMNWPQVPELIYAPCVLAATVVAIVYPTRFALGVMSVTALLVTVTTGENLPFLITMLAALAVTVHQLAEIRTRTKLITSGFVTCLVVMITSAACGLVDVHYDEFIVQHSLWAGACALLAFFVASGILPLVERLFRVATPLSLLEWRDTTRPLLQLLSREAPGTYNHSLVLGTLASAACDSVGANALLTQVGALYHDIGKIHKADYFVENQEGRINRHENLAPTMSLLIILGHVKDGIAMAKEYKLPRVLHQFIEEHHGTTVVRYFHHRASEKQPKISSGKHDREVPEAEFRYSGPKPRTRESAILMLCDSVEGAVRALPEPTVARIESVVHQIVMARLSDGQFDECDITLREIHLVEESLVKSLGSIYHGRVSYPKARKPEDEPSAQRKVSG